MFERQRIINNISRRGVLKDVLGLEDVIEDTV